MSYIGRQPVIGNFVKLDAISVVNGQAAYTMQNSSANFTDYSTVNQFMVSLNGTIQSPGSSFTVSGSTITFASNLVTNDVIDFIIVFGNSLSSGVPTDATVSTAKIVDDAVTAAKINNDIISGSTELASEPADTDEFLVSDAGTLKRLDYSLIKASGIEEIDMWRITSDYNGDGVRDLVSNWERADDAGFSVKGTGMSESSGIFTFPSTGYYQINSTGILMANGGARAYMGYGLKVTENNSSYTAKITTYDSASGNNYYGSANFSFVLRVSDTSNVKVKMFQESPAGQDVTANGNTGVQQTGLIFIKLTGL